MALHLVQCLMAEMKLLGIKTNWHGKSAQHLGLKKQQRAKMA